MNFNEQMKLFKRSNKGLSLFLICLMISACIHTASFLIFNYFPLSLSWNGKSLFKKSLAEKVVLSREEESDNLSKSGEIKDFLNPPLLSPHNLERPFDLESLFLPKINTPIPENFQNSLFTLHHFFSTPKEIPSSEDFVYNHPTLLFNEKELPLVSWEEKFEIFSPSQLEIDFSSSIIHQGQKISLANIEESLSLDEPPAFEMEKTSAPLPPLLNPIEIKTASGMKEISPLTLNTTYNPLGEEERNAFTDGSVFSSEIPLTSSLDPLAIPSQGSSSFPSKVEFYELPSVTEEVEWSEKNFDVKVYLMPGPDEKGHIFSLVLQPCLEASCQTFKQNIYFLIDRTSSVEKHRFGVFKKAVLKALPYLREGDTFNIYFLDKKCTALSKENLPFNPKSLKAAREFLEEEEYKGLFSSGDIYETLDKIPWQTEKDNEVTTAILITEGKTSLSRKKQQKFLQRWKSRYADKLRLYTATAGRDNNLMFLDLLSSQHGGKLLYSETHAAFPRKLAKLVLTLKDPLIKEITVSAIPLDPRANITLYPPSHECPVLFGKEPYVLFGTMDQISDFTLVLQGHNQEQLISLKVPISVEKAKKGGRQLEKRWALRQASTSFEQFLLKGKNKDLKAATAALEPFGHDKAYD